MRKQTLHHAREVQEKIAAIAVMEIRSSDHRFIGPSELRPCFSDGPMTRSPDGPILLCASGLDRQTQALIFGKAVTQVDEAMEAQLHQKTESYG